MKIARSFALATLAELALALFLIASHLPAYGQALSTPPNFDYLFCPTWGSVAYRSQNRWTCLPPGTSGYILRTNGANADPSWDNPAAGGTVTSVGLSAPAIFSVSGSPVTTTGTLALTLASQSQNLFFASPNGSSGAPTFRAIANADLTGLTPSFGQFVGANASAPFFHLGESDQAVDEQYWRLTVDAKVARLATYTNAGVLGSSAITATRGAGTALSGVTITPPLTLGTPLAVAQGGTGATSGSGSVMDSLSGLSTAGIVYRSAPNTWTTITATQSINGAIAAAGFSTNSLLVESPADTLGAIAPGTNGQVFVGVTGSLPAFATMSGYGTITNAGALTVTKVKGTTTNDNATAGDVGQIIESSIPSASAVTITNTSTASITSISVPAGDWDCWGNIQTYPAGGTVESFVTAGMNPTTVGFPTDPSGGGLSMVGSNIANVGMSTFIGMRRLSIASTTTLYLVINSQFSIGTNKAGGYLACRRAR